MLTRYEVVSVYVGDSVEGQYDDVIEILDTHAKEGWRLVQVLEPRRLPGIEATKLTLVLEKTIDPAL